MLKLSLTNSHVPYPGNKCPNLFIQTYIISVSCNANIIMHTGFSGFELSPSSPTLYNWKTNISGTEFISVLRWGEGDTLLCPLERANLKHWTRTKYTNLLILSVIHHWQDPLDSTNSRINIRNLNDSTFTEGVGGREEEVALRLWPYHLRHSSVVACLNTEQTIGM
jgi:hypothetical protein